MTTGNVLDDKRVYQPGLTWPGYAGPRFTKVWSGGDSSDLHAKTENPYSMDVSSFVDPVVTVVYYLYGAPVNGGSGTYLSTKGSGTVADLPSFVANDEYKLVEKLRTAIRAHEFNLGVNIGEGRESLRMIGDIAKLLAKAALLVKQGKFVSAWALFSPIRTAIPVRVQNASILGLRNILGRQPTRREARAWLSGSVLPRSLRRQLSVLDPPATAKAFGSVWLGYTYGIAPLLSEAKNLGEAVAAQTARVRKTSYTVTRRVAIPANTVGGERGHFHAGAGYLLRPGSTSVRSVRLKVTVREYENLSEELGLSDPLLVAWELVPLSFVYDWFQPVGKYLESLNFLRQTDMQVVRSDLWKMKSKIYGFYDTNTGGGITTDADFVERRVRLRRTIESSQDWVSTLPLPRFRNLFEVRDWRHVVSGISLLAQRLL